MRSEDSLRKNLHFLFFPYNICFNQKPAVAFSDLVQMLFIAEYSQGKLPTVIFMDAEFDADIIGIHRIWSASKRWRATYNTSGELGLNDSRKLNSGRPLKP